MEQFQIVAEANNPNGANKPHGLGGAEVAGKIQEKGNNPNNRNNAPRRRIISFDFSLPSVLGLLGLLNIYITISNSYTKNLSAVISAPLGLLAPAPCWEAVHA
jgi:hypothetical protein